MYAAILKQTLERHVVGQTRAVDTLVRAVTLAVSGVPRPVGPLGAFLFMGPSGTGKTHVVRSLARALHGSEERLVVADARHGGRDEAWRSLCTQVRPLFRSRGRSGIQEAPPLSILLVEGADGARPEVLRMLASALELGALPLEDGTRGSLRHAFVILTSTLCSRQILSEAGRVLGFAPSTDDALKSERARIFDSCYGEAMRRFDAPLMTRLDDVVVFHPLSPDQMREIFSRQLDELRAWLSSRRVALEVEQDVCDLVLERAARTTRAGALGLVREFRRQIGFPVADLVSGGGARQERTVRVRRAAGGSARMTELVETTPRMESVAPASRPTAEGSESWRRVPVAWDEPALVSRR